MLVELVPFWPQESHENVSGMVPAGILLPWSLVWLVCHVATHPAATCGGSSWNWAWQPLPGSSAGPLCLRGPQGLGLADEFAAHRRRDR